jgi:23S rRNA (cytosine1962-C5)-methyltransferase
MALLVKPPGCVVYEDEQILVVNKPSGLNTHLPNPYAGEGIYEWLKNHEPRWANLATIHRLDKATSGLMVFAKSALANRSLTQQFAGRKVRKRYVLLCDRKPAETEFVVRTGLVRVGEKYVARGTEDHAETRFQYLKPWGGHHLVAAEPVTGRTHQIRVHAEVRGFPILGDLIYGGHPFQRLCLHAEELSFAHPETEKEMRFSIPADFEAAAALELRRGFIDPEGTNCFRLFHGEPDGTPGLYLERWGEYLLALTPNALEPAEWEFVASLLFSLSCRGAYHKLLNKAVSRARIDEAAPQHIAAELAPRSFVVTENGVKFEVSFEQGYSAGLFLDQRENRRRLLTGYVAPEFHLFDENFRGKDVLNTFAYTCGFSLCAARAGARTTSLDLSKKYLDWGRRNFALNGVNPAEHDFIYGDVFDWTARLAKKGRTFDLVLLDPPTFSHAKSAGIFQAEKHYGRLVSAVLPILRKGGILFASTNAHKLTPESFLGQISGAVGNGNRIVVQERYIPQPIDFPISKEEPAFLKTVWLRVS